MLWPFERRSVRRIDQCVQYLRRVRSNGNLSARHKWRMFCGWCARHVRMRTEEVIAGLRSLIDNVLPTLKRTRYVRLGGQGERLQRRARRQPRSLYFLQAGDGGPIKIGAAHDPVERLQTLQVGNHERLRLIAVLPGKGSTETYLHVLFDHLRVRPDGEWFRPEQELMAYIAAAK